MHVLAIIIWEKDTTDGIMDPGTPVTDAAAFSSTSNLRPVMYTLAPFAANALAIMNPLLTGQPFVEIENPKLTSPSLRL